MALAFIIIALPFGIAVGFFLALLNGRLRVTAYFLQVALIIILWLLMLNNIKDFALGFILIPVTVISIFTMLVFELLMKPLKNLLKSIKESYLIKKYPKQTITVIIIALAILIGFFANKNFLETQEINEKLVGKWYGRERDNSYGKNEKFIYFEFDKKGNGTKLSFPYTSPGKMIVDGIKQVGDNEIYDFDGILISKVDTLTSNYFSGKIPKESKFFIEHENRISDTELLTFWENNIIPIINFEQTKILKQNNYYQFLHGNQNHENLNIISNKIGDIELQENFSLELRMGLKKFNYKDINQVVLDNGEVLLLIYFVGKEHFQHYRGLKKCYSHWGLVFVKDNNKWHLTNLNDIPDYQDYTKFRNENLDFQGMRDGIIMNGIYFSVWDDFLNDFFPTLNKDDKNETLELFNFPLQINHRKDYRNNFEITTWEAKDLLEKLDLLLNKQKKSNFKYSVYNQFVDITDFTLGDMSFETNIGIDPIEINGEIFQSVILRFAAVDGEWKVVSLDFDGSY